MRRCIACRVFNVSGKFIRGELSKTGVLMYKRSWVTLSVTSRREISRRDVQRSPLCHVATWIFTSQRQFLKPSVTSRREISRRDVILIFLCHVATCILTSRRHNISSLSLRDVAPHVTTSFGHALYHVATWDFTSRRGLICSLSRRDVTPHVATWHWF